MIALNANKNYNKNYKPFFTASSNQQYPNTNKLTYDQTVINNWTGLGAIIFGITGLALPRLEGTDDVVIKKLLTRNLPLAIVGTIIGAWMGHSIGKRKVEEHKAFIQSIADIQKQQSLQENQTNYFKSV